MGSKIVKLIRNLFSQRGRNIFKMWGPASLTGVVNAGISKLDALLRRLFISLRTGIWTRTNNAKYLRNVYARLDRKTRKEFREYLRNEADKNWWSKEELRSMTGYVRKISKKFIQGTPLTPEEQEFYNDWGKFLMRDRVGSPPVDGSHEINSSWIIRGFWEEIGTSEQGNMFLEMVRGRDIYKFYNVPKSYWIALVELSANAGTWFWKSWGWKYSAYAKNWNQKGMKK